MSTAKVPLQVAMDVEDFQRLTQGPQDWAGWADRTWAEQVRDGRFVKEPGSAEPPSLHWKFVYGLAGREYSSAILCRAFLASKGQDCEVAYDNSEFVTNGWIILTDYYWGEDE